jgi:hypothetical protein
MLDVFSDILNNIFVFSLTGYKKDNKSNMTHISNAAVKRTFAALAGRWFRKSECVKQMNCLKKFYDDHFSSQMTFSYVINW